MISKRKLKQLVNKIIDSMDTESPSSKLFYDNATPAYAQMRAAEELCLGASQSSSVKEYNATCGRAIGLLAIGLSKVQDGTPKTKKHKKDTGTTNSGSDSKLPPGT